MPLMVACKMSSSRSVLQLLLVASPDAFILYVTRVTGLYYFKPLSIPLHRRSVRVPAGGSQLAASGRRFALGHNIVPQGQWRRATAFSSPDAPFLRVSQAELLKRWGAHRLSTRVLESC